MDTEIKRGGYREGAGRKKSRPTTVLRIPECYQTQVKALINFLDDDKRKYGGAHELPPSKNIKTGKRMVLSFVLDEYHIDRHSLCDIYN
ncbi:hypothetical protein MHM89_12590 [Pseudoalteromonas sp. CNC9-20]|uniref:hypothetical protein n=1 Tax=Pseudoalteromonas sp. CNC9-20 TaxID=2917750 RepID=UPI001EF67192|nr:hypothetical protein [Pseudoalteromonas sp. CNC9-20]MCG7570775.1 hypothetical protein [Pseudoalteromonas sp. CNC9-20]